jgi:hypothetical protein
LEGSFRSCVTADNRDHWQSIVLGTSITVLRQRKLRIDAHASRRVFDNPVMFRAAAIRTALQRALMGDLCELTDELPTPLWMQYTLTMHHCQAKSHRRFFHRPRPTSSFS